jgi:pyruvate,water dikinase
MDVAFAAPGPGQWALDRSHYPGGTTPISQWVMEQSMPAGMERVFAEVGVPARRLDARFVHGFMYTRLRPLIGGDRGATRLPPLVLLKAVAHLHPEFRRRARAAERTLRDVPSREVAERWERELRPELRRRNEQLQAVDPDALDDAALQRHVDDLLDQVRSNFELHFWLHGHDIGPIARFLYECERWGIAAARAVAALAGASPSTVRPQRRLRRLRELVESSGRAVRSLDDVRAVSPEASALVDEHLAEYGDVLATGYDITSLTLGEIPGAVLDSIRTATVPDPVDVETLAAPLRDTVPASERQRFDALLDDARAVMDMRDDNGLHTVEWPVGLLRRALLAAGRRRVQRRELDDAEQALELTVDEAHDLFGERRPTAATLERRADRRRAEAALDPPSTLGPAEPSPPPDVLPSPLDVTVAMVQVALEHMGMAGNASADPLVGAGVGTGAYVGRARTAASADEAIDKLEPGDVLVVRATSPAFNVVLAIAGAVVTADGGAMSHAAVLARELGIPAVVGARGALDIPDGATVEVDPGAGRVRVLTAV